MLIVGKRAFPWLLWQAARTGSRELFTLCVVTAAVSLAFGAASSSASPSRSAHFSAGMVINKSEFSARAAEESLPLRTPSPCCSLSVGKFFDPSVLIDSPLRVLARRRQRHDRQSADRGGHRAFLSLSARRRAHDRGEPRQIGEFSFILAGLGMSLGLLPHEGQNLVLAGARISITLDHFAFQAIAPIEAWLLSIPPLARFVKNTDDPGRAADGDGG